MTIADYGRAIVTGASSGIGAATARALAARGVEVHAVARRRDRLEALAEETGCEIHILDMRDTDGLHRLLGGIEADILVNNAGVGRGLTGLFEAEPADVEATIALNVTSLLQAIRAVAPGMMARKSGHIVNIGSVAGLYPLMSSVYGGSKGAVHLISRNLRLELQGAGVRVTEICPGRVATEFFDAAIDDDATRAKTTATGIEELTSEDIADAIMFALDAPWRVNVSTIELAPTEQAYGGVRFKPVGD